MNKFSIYIVKLMIINPSNKCSVHCNNEFGERSSSSGASQGSGNNSRSVAVVKTGVNPISTLVSIKRSS